MAYTRADLRTAVTGRIHNKIGMFSDAGNTVMNTAVRRVWNKLDLRSAKIAETLSPDLEAGVYSYVCPTKLKGFKIIGLQPVTVDRTNFDAWELVSEDEFDRRKLDEDNTICIAETEGTRTLKISSSLVDPADYTIVYYSKYPWTTGGTNPTYKLTSTEDTDFLICDEDEFDLFVEKTVELMSQELREADDTATARAAFKDLVKTYQTQYKSEALQLQDTYYNF